MRENIIRTVHLKVESIEQMGKEFSKTWHNAKIGNKVSREATLSFQDSDTMLKVISSGRHALLSEIYKLGNCSIRALAKHVKRDYRNVHRDVKILQNCGLVNNKNNVISTRWANIVVELPLITEAEDTTANHKSKHKKAS